jgi:hypothetical protein
VIGSATPTLFGRRVSIAKSKRAAPSNTRRVGIDGRRGALGSQSQIQAHANLPLPTPSALRVQIAALLDLGARLDRKSKRARRICRQAARPDRKSKRTPTPSAPRVSIANPSALRVQILASRARRALRRKTKSWQRL